MDDHAVSIFRRFLMKPKFSYKEIVRLTVVGGYT